MTTVNVHEAKSRLSQLIAEVEAGGEVVIARAGAPIVRLVRLSGPAPQRAFGAMKGRASTTDAFFEPLSEDELASWE